MSRALLSLNVGSSSIKFALYRLGEGAAPERVAGGLIERIGTAPRFLAATAGQERAVIREWGETEAEGEAEAEAPGYDTLLAEVLGWVERSAGGWQLAACGHRVVHGGTGFVRPVVIDEGVLGRLAALNPLAPLHQPHNLAAIRAMRALAPDVPQVACFDTAFHAGKPALAARFALPRALHERGIRRYGFHGLSYEYIARNLAQHDPALAGGRVIAAHLGNGASLCALLGGRSVDTTMGFTALDGLMMGTRCGALDPGVVLHLLQQEGMSVEAVETLLYRQSGLLGVSGVSSDMRLLAESDAPEAEEAIALFCWRAAREAGALMVSLGGLDGLVFTAGIGEHQADVRARICAALGWCGILLDAPANAADAAVISAPDSRVTVRVVPTDEERMIALHTAETLGLQHGDGA